MTEPSTAELRGVSDAQPGQLTYARRWHNWTEVLPTAFAWNGHPLVVIDPEDREQVEQFARAYEATWMGGAHSRESTLDIIVRQMQAALRSLITPPGPKEPTDPAVRVTTGGNVAGCLEIQGESREWARSTAGRWVCLNDCTPGALTWEDLVRSFGPVGFTGTAAAS